MPVAEQIRIDTYTGNGSTTNFAYGFRIFEDADLLVVVDGVTKVLTTDYTVNGAGDAGGGSIDFITAPVNLLVVTISGELTYDRSTDYIENGAMRAGTVDDDMDKGVMLDQQLRRDVKRSIKVPVEETSDQEVSSIPADRANKVLSFDASGLPVAQPITDLSTVLTSVDESLNLASQILSVVNPNRLVVASGTVDVITGSTTPAPASLTNNLAVLVEAAGANTVTTPTFNLSSLGAKTIVKDSNAALVAGDIPGANFRMILVFDASLDKWVLLNPAAYLSTVTGGTVTGAVALSSTLAVTGVSTLTGGFKTEGTDIIKMKIVDIGDWDMVATSSLNVNHGITNGEKYIINIQGFVRTDTTGGAYPIALGHTPNIDLDPVMWNLGSSTLSLKRFTGGFFDDVLFDSTSYNRGRLFITYTDIAIS